jgi:TonB family protein
MSTGPSPAVSITPTHTRRVPRYKLTVPLDLTVLRSGIPDNVPGRTLEIGEGGMGVVVASQLLLGESVRVEFLLPHTNTPVRATAVVRYQRELCCGLQFVRLPVEQQSIIRYWTRCEAALSLLPQKSNLAQAGAALADTVANAAPLPDFAQAQHSKLRFPAWRAVAWAVSTVVIAAAMLVWWQWQQGWKELEAQVPLMETMVTKPQWQVPAEVMRRRIRHNVVPEYPQDARRARVQGTVTLDAVVSAEGTVTQLKYVTGPEALSQAAMNAVRWWRYEPYVVDGRPAAVETTVAVDFRLPN